MTKRPTSLRGFIQRFSEAPIFEYLADERGTSLVEFAIVLIPLAMLLLGVIGFGHALYAYHFVNNAAKEATRWAAVNGSTCNADGSCNGTFPMNNGPASSADIDAYVQNHIPPGINPTRVTTSACGVSDKPACAESTPVICNPFPNYPTCTVQVTVSYPFTFIVPLLPATKATTLPCMKPGICLSSSSEMIIVH